MVSGDSRVLVWGWCDGYTGLCRKANSCSLRVVGSCSRMPLPVHPSTQYHMLPVCIQWCQGLRVHSQIRYTLPSRGSPSSGENVLRIARY